MISFCWGFSRLIGWIRVLLWGRCSSSLFDWNFLVGWGNTREVFMCLIEYLKSLIRYHLVRVSFLFFASHSMANVWQCGTDDFQYYQSIFLRRESRRIFLLRLRPLYGWGTLLMNLLRCFQCLIMRQKCPALWPKEHIPEGEQGLYARMLVLCFDHHPVVIQWLGSWLLKLIASVVHWECLRLLRWVESS